MINFMVLGGPRSGTTWAANWLTTDRTICLHDPLLEYQPAQLMRMTFPHGERLGISCTASTMYPDWVNALQCPKVILYRSVEEINNSLRALGMTELIEIRHLKRLGMIERAMFVPYEYLFSPTGAEKIAEHLDVPFNRARHDLLRQMRVEPMWKHLNVGKEAATSLVKRIVEAR